MDRRALIEDRFSGACLGLMVGDALGMPIEGWTAERISEKHGRLKEMLAGRLPAGSYTDDGQMAIGLLESLVRARSFDPALCAERWLANFDAVRGYGGRIKGIMTRLTGGESWDKVGTDSFGNGSAMRIGPLGAYLYDRRDELLEAAVTSAGITHRHPQALAGGLIQALAVAGAMAAGLTGEPIEIGPFIDQLMAKAGRIDTESAAILVSLKKIEPGSPEHLRDQLLGRYRCDVRAIESVGPALGSFLHTDSFEAAVCLAVNLGGDTDTIGAMAGSIAGAYFGRAAIPERWLHPLEDREYVESLCAQAAEQLVGR